jgi:hypothetical protein
MGIQKDVLHLIERYFQQTKLILTFISLTPDAIPSLNHLIHLTSLNLKANRIGPAGAQAIAAAAANLPNLTINSVR